MATHAYSLPDAQERVGILREIFASGEHEEISADQVFNIAATIIARADDLLAYLPVGAGGGTREVTTLRALTQTLRKTAFLLMHEVDPDHAWYWTPENQARIREADQFLMPELRAEILAEAAADDAALEQAPDARAAIRAEDALWDATAGDGLDAD